MRKTKRQHLLPSYRNSSVDVNDKHPSQEVPGQRIDIWGDLILTGLDFGEEGSNILVIERESTGEEGIEDHTTAPYVSRVPLVFHTVHDFGARIMRTATTGFELESGRSESGHSPIGQFDQGRIERMYQYVFGLEVAVDDRKCMCVVESVDDLFEKRQGIEGREATAVDEEIEKLATFDVLQHKIKFILAFEDIVYAQYVWMVHEFHHDDLPIDSKTLFREFRQVGSQGCTGVHEWLEREDFHSGELTRAAVSGDADPSTGTLADAFTNDPLSDIFRVLGKIESTDTSGGLLLLPASSQVGVVLDRRCSRWGVDYGCHEKSVKLRSSL